jgi:phage terminase large subunit GpA-like protein
VFAIKGVPGPKPVIEATKSKWTKARGARLYLVGVEQVKTDLLSSLDRERGQPMAIRFSDTLTEEWFIQFTSERRKVEYRKGKPVVEFARIGYRSAEALDASVYAVAVRSLCRFDFARRQQELTKDAPQMRRRSIGSVAARLNG